MRHDVPLPQAYRLINHGPTVLVSAAHGGRRNVMAAAWNTVFEFDPPRVGVVLDKSSFTRGLVEASGRFTLQVPCRDFADATFTVGSTSGHTLADKIAHFGLATFAARTMDAPLLEGCIAWLECRVIPEPHVQQAYDLFVGEVFAAQADERVFTNGRWRDEIPPGLATLHHVGGGRFFCAGSPLQAQGLAERPAQAPGR